MRRKTKRGVARMRHAATFVWLAVTFVLPAGAMAQLLPLGPGTPSREVRMKMAAGVPDYCSGPRGGTPYMAPAEDPGDITLRLPLRVRYDNHGPATILLPNFTGWVTRMSVAGSEESTILRDARIPGLVNVERMLSMSAPDETGDFYILPPEGDTGPVLSVLETGAYSRWQEGVTIAVVNHASGIDLRGQMIEIELTRDHRSLPSDVVETLNERWNDYGTVWTGVVESEPMSFFILPEPLFIRDCVAP